MAALIATTVVIRDRPAGAQGPETTRPNLLLVTFDTTRADRLTPYGYTDARMPAIERLAREGVVFTHAYAPAVQTLPSHAAMMTGPYPITSNVVSNGQRLDREILTLAELLRAEGYRTGAVVATAPLLEVFGLSQGFETYDDDFEDPFVFRAAKSLLRFFFEGSLEPLDHAPGASCGGTRGRLIFRMPGRLPAGGRLTTPSQLVDVTPTVMRLLGFSLKGAPFQGQDLFSLDPQAPRRLFAMAARLFTREPIVLR